MSIERRTLNDARHKKYSHKCGTLILKVKIEMLEVIRRRNYARHENCNRTIRGESPKMGHSTFFHNFFL